MGSEMCIRDSLPGLPSGRGSLCFWTGRGSACIPDHLPGPSFSPKPGSPSYEDGALRPVDIPSPSPRPGSPSYEDGALRPVNMLDSSSGLRPSAVLFQSYLCRSMFFFFNFPLLYAKRYYETDCWFEDGFGTGCFFGVWLLFRCSTALDFRDSDKLTTFSL